MKLKYFGFACLAALAMGATSCDDKLDIPRKGVLSMDAYYQTDEDAEGAITMCYQQLSNMDYDYFMCKGAMGDDFWAGGSKRGDNVDLEYFNEFTFDANGGYILSLFQTFYKIIYSSNVVLENVPSGEDGGTDVMKRARAEAQVFRAWAYFELISMWGTPPLVNHTLSASEYNVPNGDPAALWALVEGDLKAAIASGMLSEKAGLNDKSQWRITKQYAQALLGKAYLWQEKYKEAAQEFDNVIGSGKYDLYRGDYGEIMQVTTKNCEESLFELQRVNDPKNSPFTMTTLMIHWRTDQIHGFESVKANSTGWGFLAPRKDFYEEAVANDGPDSKRILGTLKTYKQMNDLGIYVNSATKTINEGFFMWKWRVSLNELCAGSAWNSFRNTRYMRLAEVYLCGAEAHLKSNDPKTALKYVNEIRKRAGIPELESVTMDNIMTEKRIELIGEFTRYQDLIRWKIADQKMKDQGKVCPFLDENGNVEYLVVNDVYGFKEKHWLLPFPQKEVDQNTEIKQNPGWE